MGVRRFLDDLRFWAQVEGDARRTVYCQPADHARVAAAVAEQGLGRVLTVRSSPCVPDGKLIVVDEQALDAAHNEAMQRLARRPFE